MIEFFKTVNDEETGQLIVKLIVEGDIDEVQKRRVIRETTKALKDVVNFKFEFYRLERI